MPVEIVCTDGCYKSTGIVGWRIPAPKRGHYCIPQNISENIMCRTRERLVWFLPPPLPLTSHLPLSSPLQTRKKHPASCKLGPHYTGLDHRCPHARLGGARLGYTRLVRLRQARLGCSKVNHAGQAASSQAGRGRTMLNHVGQGQTTPRAC